MGKLGYTIDDTESYLEQVQKERNDFQIAWHKEQRRNFELKKKIEALMEKWEWELEHGLDLTIDNCMEDLEKLLTEDKPDE